MKSWVPAALYRGFIEWLPIACVDVTIVHRGGALLVRRKDDPARGQWWVPGGRVHKGERLREAAARKAREETGLECHVGPILHTAETIFPDGPGGIAIHSINTCFLLYPVGKTVRPRLDSHHEGAKWVRTIPAGLHSYVERCLEAAGLQRGSMSDGGPRAGRARRK